MRTGQSTTRRSRADWIVRGFWLALVAIHVAPLISVGSQCRAGLSAVLLGKILGILLSMGFFGAKAAGARFLRVRCKWTGAIVFLAICSLVHQNLREEVFAEPAAIVSVAFIAAAARLIPRRVWPKLLGGVCEFLVSLLRAGTWQKLVECELLPTALVFERASTVPRGPPTV
jgi:hypothetical protein